MAHDAALREQAKEMFVINGFSMDTIDALLPEVSRKTLYNWRGEDDWEDLRRQRVEKVADFREQFETAAKEAVKEYMITKDPKLLFAATKVISALKQMSTFEFPEEKRDKEKQPVKKKGLTPEELEQLEEEILSL